MFCGQCGKRINIADIVCPFCSSVVLYNNNASTVQQEQEIQQESDESNDQPSFSSEEYLEYAKNFVPTANERFIRCRKCGQDNYRGENTCVNCGYPIVPTTMRDEMVIIDDNIVSQLSPRLKESYFKLGCQLLVLKIIKKLELYPCDTIIEMPDGKRRTCGYLLSFRDKICPNCKQENDITYNCSNYNENNDESSCNQKISLNMLSCPSCGSSTLLNDLMTVINGNAIGDEAIEYIKTHVQPHFSYFPLIKKTLKTSIDHLDLIQTKFELQNIARQGSKIFEWLAIYLRIMMKERKSFSMPTSISDIQNIVRGNISSPQRSPEMVQLYQNAKNNNNKQDDNQAVPAQDEYDGAGNGGDENNVAGDDMLNWGTI